MTEPYMDGTIEVLLENMELEQRTSQSVIWSPGGKRGEYSRPKKQHR